MGLRATIAASHLVHLQPERPSTSNGKCVNASTKSSLVAPVRGNPTEFHSLPPKRFGEELADVPPALGVPHGDNIYHVVRRVAVDVPATESA